MAVTSTVAAARSLAMRAKGCLSGLERFTIVSATVFISSATHTKPMAIMMASHSNLEISSQKETATTATVATAWIQMLGWVLNAKARPFIAQAKDLRRVRRNSALFTVCSASLFFKIHSALTGYPYRAIK